MSSDLDIKVLGAALAKGGTTPVYAAPGRRLADRYEPKEVETKEKKDDKPEEATPDIAAGILSGVIAATVSTNRIMPVAVNPSEWDVLACYHAVISEDFSSFKLPPQKVRLRDAAAEASGHTPPLTTIRLADYATGLINAEFEDNGFDLDPRKQNLFDVRGTTSFAIQGLAVCDQSGLSKINNLSDGNLVWAGPYQSAEQYLMSLSISDHRFNVTRITPANPETGAPSTSTTIPYILTHELSEQSGVNAVEGDNNVRITVPDVETVAPGHSAIVDITFISMNGGEWQIFPVRIR